MSNLPWSINVNDLVDAFASETPLLISRVNTGDYSEDDLDYADGDAPSTFNVKGAIVPKFAKGYTSAQLPNVGTENNAVQIYIKTNDVHGTPFVPQIGDTVNDTIQDYLVIAINAIRPNGAFCGYILDVSA